MRTPRPVPSAPDRAPRPLPSARVGGGAARASLLPALPFSRPTTRRAAGGVLLPPAGIGTWSWGNRFLFNYAEDQDADIGAAFATAVRCGVALFDSGDSYGTGRLAGRAEALLGAGLAALPSPAARRRVVVATKIAPYPWRLTPASWVAALRGSLARLGTDTLAIGQLHWSTSTYAPWQERATWDGLIAAYDAGLMQAAGVSNYGPRQLARVARHLARAGVPLAVVQTQCSLLSCGPDTRAALAAAADVGAVTLAYSPLALGALSGKYTPARVPPGPRGRLLRKTLAGADDAGLLAELDAVAATARATRSQVALAWCVAKGTVPIAGARTAAQVESHARGARLRLPSGAVEALDAAAARVKTPTLQNVFVTK